LRKKYFRRLSLTAAAKAGPENKPVVAAVVNRCANQNQVHALLFPQAVKPCPSQNRFMKSPPGFAGEKEKTMRHRPAFGIYNRDGNRSFGNNP
jgi:hypothetical protein